MCYDSPWLEGTAGATAADRQVLFALLSVNLSMVATLYAMYTPSFGNDTYRDAIVALNALKYEGYKPAYIGTPFLSMGYARYLVNNCHNVVM